MRSENTWQEIRDHSFIQNHSRSFRFTDPWRCFFSSVHSCSTGFRSENTWQEIRDHSFIQNHSRSFRFTDPWRCFFSSVHSCSTGFRSENTWQEIRDHSFIQNHSRSSDSQIHDGASSLQFTHLLQGSGQRTPDKRSETIPSSRITPDLQIHRSMTVLLLFSSLMFYRVQIREHLTRDQIPFLHPESLQILQIHRSMTVLLQFTHVLQGSGQRTPDKRSETIPSSRITPDPSDSQIHDGASSLQFTHVLQGSGQRTGMVAEAWFCAQWPIFVLFLRFVFGLLYSLKIQTWLIIRFLTESVTCWYFICCIW